jgi:NADH-quinone oxidoreductase subunit J
VTGNVKQIGTIMFSKYFLPFEITSFLLLVAMIGVVVISRRRVEEV